MNKEQWDIIVTGVLDFNRLITTPEERNTKEYYLKCCDLLQEESDEGMLAYVNRLNYYRNRDGWKCTTEMLDAFADIIVVGTQAIDCVSPSQLDWDYVSKFLEDPTEVCNGYRHTFLTPVVNAVLEAELEDCDIFGAMCEVNRSNNTKIPTVDLLMQYYGDDKEIHEAPVEVAANYAAADIAASLDYEFEITPRIFIDQYGVDRVAFYDQNKKLRKPWCYEEPQLEKYL